MSGWQPMDTCPPEGQFLVYMPEHHLCKIQVAMWHPNCKIIGGCFAFDMPTPTHWHPLPPPPLKEQT